MTMDDNGDERREDAGQGGNHLPQGIYIIGIDRHQVAMGVLVEVGDRQLLHVTERIATEPEQCSLTDIDHQPALQIGAYSTCQQNDGQFANGQGQWGIVGCSSQCERNDVVIDERLGEKGRGESGHRRDESACQNGEQAPFIVREDHAKQAYDGLPPFFGKVFNSSCMSWATWATVWIQCWGHMLNKG